MIKGMPIVHSPLPQFLSDPIVLVSVMSGVITGPYFRKYFNEPDAIQVGTMVAVLEIGAFSMSPQEQSVRVQF